MVFTNKFYESFPKFSTSFLTLLSFVKVWKLNRCTFSQYRLMKRSLNKVYNVAFVAVAVKLNLESTVNSTTVSVRLILPKVEGDEFA